VYRAIEDHAYDRAVEMSYADKVLYARRHFVQASEAQHRRFVGSEPIFTRAGPGLSRVAVGFEDDATAMRWLSSWLADPAALAPGTLMPSMRLGPVGSSGRAPAPESPSDDEPDEAVAIAAYLVELGHDHASSWPVLDDSSDKRQRFAGERDLLIDRILAEQGDGSAALDAPGLDDVILSELEHRFAQVGSTGVDGHRPGGMTADERRWMFLGQRMLSHYGCYTCHRIAGFETDAGPGVDLTRWADKPLIELDFGRMLPGARGPEAAARRSGHVYPAGQEALTRYAIGNPTLNVERTHASFAWYKVLNPRLWDRGRNRTAYEKLRMPTFFLKPDEADDLVTWILSHRAQRVDASLRPGGETVQAVAAARELARDLNCEACHRLAGNTPVIDPYYYVFEGQELRFDRENAPPELHGQGAKTQPDWLRDYLLSVQPLRPWLTVRMPQFSLSAGQAEMLTHGLAALGRREAIWLRHHLALTAGELQAVEGNRSRLVAHRRADALDALRRYAVSERLLPEFVLEPVEGAVRYWNRERQRVLKDARFLGDLMDAPYPFTEMPYREPAPEVIHDGRVLFMELECLSCHVFGDPETPGANAAPTAQNLALTHERLQRRWCEDWMRAPARIQPGTKMPAHFGDGKLSAFVAYPPAERERIRARLEDPMLLDDGPRQIECITWFMYDAGRRGLDVIQPGGLKDAPTVGTAPAGQEDDEQDAP
jgi:hypothetical protein